MIGNQARCVWWLAIKPGVCGDRLSSQTCVVIGYQAKYVRWLAIQPGMCENWLSSQVCGDWLSSQVCVIIGYQARCVWWLAIQPGVCDNWLSSQVCVMSGYWSYRVPYLGHASKPHVLSWMRVKKRRLATTHQHLNTSRIWSIGDTATGFGNSHTKFGVLLSMHACVMTVSIRGYIFLIFFSDLDVGVCIF